MTDFFNNSISVGNLYRDYRETPTNQDANVGTGSDGGLEATGEGNQVERAMMAGGSESVGWVSFLLMFGALYGVTWYAGKREDFALIMPSVINILIIGIAASLFIVGAKTVFTAYPVKHISKFVHTI